MSRRQQRRHRETVDLDAIEKSLMKEIERNRPTTIWGKFRALFYMSKPERKLIEFKKMFGL